MEKNGTVLAKPPSPQVWRQEAAFLDAIAQVTFQWPSLLPANGVGMADRRCQAAAMKRLQETMTL